MSLAEGVQGIIRYQPYASGAISPNTEDQAPTTTGAQVLRRVSSSLNLKKNTYLSNEVRSDRQIFDFRHGVHHVDGDIAGELSLGTYFDMFEAVHRDTRQAAVTSSQTDFTTMQMAASAGTITFTGGDPVAKGFKIGDPIRVTGDANSANNGVTFFITSFGGTSNRTVYVLPKPADSGSVSSTFTFNRIGKSTIIPASGHVSRKFGFEIFNEDVGVWRLFTEVRAAKYMLSLPATGLATATMSYGGRSMVDGSGGTPYFDTNTQVDVTTGTALAAVNGSLLFGGTQVGVITSAEVTVDNAVSYAEVVGQNFPAEIFLGRSNCSGRLTCYLSDTTIFGDFMNETELELLLRLNASVAAGTDAATLYLPRIKLGGADLALQGEGGQIITAPFQALRYVGATPGKINSTIRMVDTTVV